MESKSTYSAAVDNTLMTVVFLTLFATILPDVIFKESIGSVPAGLSVAKLMAFIMVSILFRHLKHEKVAKYTTVLSVVVLAEILTSCILLTALWQNAFDRNTFAGNFGGTILLKFIGIFPVVGVLLALFKSPAAVYIAKGDLSIKAGDMKWLGIKRDRISWGRLSVVSAILISTGTILLTILTVTGSAAKLNISALITYLPLVVLFAAVNSLCEGILFRSAILGPLKDVLPKDFAVFVAAFMFGIAHYYGVPRGIVGVFMSTLLGWYMCRSMYETKGFVSSWIIHFMQDVVIFSTMLLFGNYR